MVQFWKVDSVKWTSTRIPIQGGSQFELQLLQTRLLHAVQAPAYQHSIGRTWILVKGKVASLTAAVSAMMAHPLLYGTCSPARAPSSVRSTAWNSAASGF
jgi:hypothetical protein